MDREIYLDNAATTKPDEKVIEAVARAMRDSYGNPSSLHKKGIEAEGIFRESSEVIAKSLKVKPGEIIFNSGGTESNNSAIIGTALAYKRTGMHIVTTELEHPSVTSVTEYLKQLGFDVTYIAPDNTGRIDPDTLKKAIRPDTTLVSVMTVNNEIGTIQDIASLAKAAKEANPDIRFHTDAVQAYGKLRLTPEKWSVDMMSVSGHKLHGPKGVGFLYMPDTGKTHPYIHGGGQQKNRRSGTENIPGIAGLGAAARLANDGIDEHLKKAADQKRLFLESISDIENVVIQGVSENFSNDRKITEEEIKRSTDTTCYSPYIISVGVKDVKSEVLLHALEEEGIYVSSGSACSSNHPGISRTLTATGSPKEYIDSTIRLSLSRFTTDEEIRITAEAFHKLIPTFRRFVKR